MAFTDLLAAICIFVNAVKGLSALELSRDLDCQYKTAFVLAHKLREALASEIAGRQLDGEVEIDGQYHGGHIRPANLKEDRVDRRLAQHQTGERRVVVALRQRGGRTLPFVVKAEAEGVEIAKRVLAASAILHADEASHWDALHASWQTGRINHSQAYSLDGACTNQVESYFARLRRMIRGQHHRVSPRYLYQYANEAAWKEDHRRLSNGALAAALWRWRWPLRSAGCGLGTGSGRLEYNAGAPCRRHGHPVRSDITAAPPRPIYGRQKEGLS